MSSILKLFLAIFLIIAIISNTSHSVTQDKAKRAPPQDSTELCNNVNCRVPLCKCSNTEIPNDVPFDDTPMMIALSFNGVLTSGHSKYLKQILNPIFKNPNDCPIQGTFFVSDKGNGSTDYCFVQGLFNNNNEIGVGSTEYE